MTHQERNAAIIRKIEAYTKRVNASPETARAALAHEREVFERNFRSEPADHA